ncbi:extracellular solute-binding protein [Halarsenatibacter silvermanii]|uniref:Extracellular solute-binding protein n=1 Tax=Halarsenatibacter silvermanii TaxID=321763 RepID=A0A1G9THR1_9FIRM|nr:extracellular solute-binding protein [Halarsenatibacter silvermanii]SDM47306.1 extracellular solute-binding protein [Halarsenatibacter silvermanii]
MKIKLLGIMLILAFALVFSPANVEALPEDMPEKPDQLEIIGLDIDVEQFGEGVENFEEEYGIEVNWMEYPYGDLRDQITTSIHGGTEFDLYMMSNSWHPELGQLGMAVPLGDVASQETLDEINERYFETTVDFVSSHGEQWALSSRHCFHHHLFL